MARVPLATREDLTPEQLVQWDKTAERGPILNVIKLWFTNPDLESSGIRAWRASGLSKRSRELVILRVAFRRKSQYEWHQHVAFSRTAGIPDADINAVREWEPSSAFSEDERALLAFVDAIIDQGRPDEATWDAVAKHRSTSEMVGVTHLITYYFQLSMIMEVMDLETEDPFVGWEL